MDYQHPRAWLQRDEHARAEALHLFSLEKAVATLRDEAAYARNGHDGLLLVKTPHLRVVLEAARRGTRIAEHRVRGPTVLQVLEGTLGIASGDATREAHAGEMVVVPHDRPRRLWAETDAAFLWVLSVDDAADG